ncbi:MAG: succinate dehydrogenase [Planctomycetota bacterium]|nr:MAG: succinate dehydrogenase [Planctomycetota bacterium]
MNERVKRRIDEWDDLAGQTIAPGTSQDLDLRIGESYSGMNMTVPLHVRRGIEPGPIVFVTAAVHGNELNGTGAIRNLIRDPQLELVAGALVLIPVVNVLGFDRHSRYLPDRRDLNRCFPGSRVGSLAKRIAWRIFDEIVNRCDYGIDLHTAAIRRTNYPVVCADTTKDTIREWALSLGTEYVVKGRGPRGALRRQACTFGCPTVIVEGGETWKVEAGVVSVFESGIRNALAQLGMTAPTAQQACKSPQTIIQKARWVRAEHGGFLEFHVQPGQRVRSGDPLVTVASLLGRGEQVMRSTMDAVVLGMTTLPATSPGEAIVHLGDLSSAIQVS